jgi:L-threonylcarbamoyladenylate synthase
LNLASNFIKKGELVVFPTETVYGIGADAFNKEAVEKIFSAKKRPNDNPLIIHISNYEMLNSICKETNKIENKLIKYFWPGPFSIVLKKSDKVPNIVTANLDTVAVRMPNHKVALDFINKCNTPIAAPSANVSSRPSGTNVQDIYDELKDKVSYFIDENDSFIGIESTVVQVIGDNVHILRPGKITKEDIEKIVDNVIVDKNVLVDVKNEKVLSPGMKHKHYSPSTKCVVILGNDLKIIDKMNDLNDDKCCFMVTTENINKLKSNKVLDLGNSLEEVSKNLFKLLREVDKLNCNICYIQGFENSGFGLSLMNRIIKACEYNKIEV